MSTKLNTAPRKSGTTYFVYADYGYVSERELHSGTDWDKACQVFRRETSDSTDMDCEITMELSSFAASGEYIVHDQQAPEEDQDEWDDGVVAHEDHLTAAHDLYA